MMRCLFLMVALALTGCFDPASMDDHPSPRGKEPTRTLGNVVVGTMAFPVRIDTLKYHCIDTILVESGAYQKEQVAFRNRLGVPAAWVITGVLWGTEKRKTWKFSAEDVMEQQIRPMRPEHVYHVEYGYQGVWHAVNKIHNLLKVQELVPYTKRR